MSDLADADELLGWSRDPGVLEHHSIAEGVVNLTTVPGDGTPSFRYSERLGRMAVILSPTDRVVATDLPADVCLIHARGRRA